MSEDEKFVREIRIDPVVPTESVLVSTARGQRPRKKEQPAPRDTRAHVETCPFCRGNEQMTPPQIASYGESGQWDIRIVENLYPVLKDDQQGPNVTEGLRQTIDGYGRHEVIIDHHNHGIGIHEMSPQHLARLFSAYRERMAQLYQTDPRLKYVLVFKNFGPAAGASIPHTHSQMIALPIIPENVAAEVQFSRTYYRANHSCVYCTLIDEAMNFYATVYDRETGEHRRLLDIGLYVIEKSEHFVAIKPFASRFEWEVHIFPLVHKADFMDAAKDELDDLAQLVRRVMARLDQVIGGAQYNYFFHTVPHNLSEDHDDSYHWHLEICPRTSIPTGFELGSGLLVNTIAPEEAARQLRDVKLDF
jgi:UDPglucose--hexose-1-phosphate uridylyltransferase